MSAARMNALRKSALRHPGTKEGVACAGTALEARTIKAGGKVFLFLRATEARLKLSDSLAEAAKLATKHPGRIDVGKGGWVRVAFGDDDVPPADVLLRWADESHALLAPQPKKKKPAAR
jgi:hypothetical protein